MKDKDRLEKYIEENRSQFDVYEPSTDLWEKIIISESKTKKVYKNNLIWKAAVVIALIATSYMGFYVFNEKVTVFTEQCSPPSEVIEAEMYYVQQVNTKLQEVYKYASIYPDIKDEVNYDLSELDSIYIDLKNDLCDNVSNEEVIEAMIQNYRMKLEILEDILMHLQELNIESEKTIAYEI